MNMRSKACSFQQGVSKRSVGSASHGCSPCNIRHVRLAHFLREVVCRQPKHCHSRELMIELRSCLVKRPNMLAIQIRRESEAMSMVLPPCLIRTSIDLAAYFSAIGS